jgi:aminomethyltransferase
MTPTPARTPLHDWHAVHGGRLVDFAGWSMPVQYASIVSEHVATRTAAGLFDVSHMGRLRFDGPGAAVWLDAILTRNVARLQPGQVRYSLITNDGGGILDDVLISRLADAAGGTYYLLVVNASNRAKIVDWLAAHPPVGQATVADLTTQWAMIAVQGPHALALAQPLVETDLAAMKYYTAVETRIAGHGGIVSRTGYTGEDGVELIVGSNAVVGLWETLLASGREAGAMAAGLGCRDTLRLEAAMPLYGHELTEAINPYQAGLGFAVDLKKGPFPGREALAAIAQDTAQPVRVGLELAGKRIAREGSGVVVGGRIVGHVTSGTFAPTLQKSIAMAYVPAEAASPGGQVEVDIRGRTEAAAVVKLPFYQRPAT